MDEKFDLQIDENNLDKEWIEQPRKYFKAAAKLADARRDLDYAKGSLDVTKAELDKAIRKSPEQYGFAKVTESVIATAIPAQESYIKARNEVIEARHKMDIYQAYVTALDPNRKTGLVKLVDLFLANYFSRPKAKEGAKDRMDEVDQKATWSRKRGGRRKED